MGTRKDLRSGERHSPAPRLSRHASRIGLIAVLAVAFWLIREGSASATMPFNPTFDVSVSNANVGVRANVTTVHSVPAGNHLIDSINIFIPIDWQIAAGDTYPAGNAVGQVSGKADMGCNGSVDNLAPGNLINQPLAPTDPSQAAVARSYPVVGKRVAREAAREVNAQTKGREEFVVYDRHHPDWSWIGNCVGRSQQCRMNPASFACGGIDDFYPVRLTRVDDSFGTRMGHANYISKARRAPV